MSNGGTWQPPQPGGPPPPSAPPPGPGVTSAGPGGYVPAPPPPPTGYGPTADPGDAQPPAGGRSRGKVVALVVGVAALVAAGVFAATRLGGDEAAGGAESPEAVGAGFLQAIEDEDVLGMIDLLLPGERETLRGPATELVDELRRLGVLSDEASLSEVGGVDLRIEDEEITVEPTNVDDIANVRMSGTTVGSVNGEDLPIGDLITDNFPELDPSEIDEDEASEAFEDVQVTAVRKDGRWYLSAFYTAAEGARTLMATDGDEVEIPTEGLTPTGGDSPEDAFDAFLDGIEGLDLTAIMASLNPNEFEALQRYAPLFVEEGQDELDQAEVAISLDEADYETSVDGDTATIDLTYLSGELTAEGESASFTWEGGCLTLEIPDEEPVNSCEVLAETSETEIPPEFEDIARTITDAFADYDNPGIVMKRVDDIWYLSPMATSAEQFLAFVQALDRDEIEQIGTDVGDLFDEMMDDLSGGALDIPDEILERSGTDEVTEVTEVFDPEIEEPAVSAPDFTLPEVAASVPSSDDEGATDPGGADECFAAETAADAVECYDAALQQGDIEPSSVPIYLRVPECGMAEPFWEGGLFSLSDAEFMALVEEAAPCFQARVADGTIDEFELPIELSHPQCLEDRNWYTVSDDEGYLDRVFECAFG